jgi:hypothetical protein
MANLKDVVAYLCQKYPHKNELSKARLTKLVYLADWRSAITQSKQLTSIEWTFNHFGPYVDDVVALARSDADFEVRPGVTMYGDEKETIGVRRGLPCSSLTADDKQVLDFVIESTQGKNWDSFIRLVYSTYPIVSKPRFAMLNLVELAREYKEKDMLVQ